MRFLPTCRTQPYAPAVSYFRHRYSSFEEFQREGLHGGERLGKEELELLEELEAEDLFAERVRRRHRPRLD